MKYIYMCQILKNHIIQFHSFMLRHNGHCIELPVPKNSFVILYQQSLQTL